MAEESSEAAALQKQLAARERELSRQAAQLAKDAAEAEVRGREAAKQLAQAEASQALLERRAEELSTAEVRVRELQVGGSGRGRVLGLGFGDLQREMPPARPGGSRQGLQLRADAAGAAHRLPAGVPTLQATAACLLVSCWVRPARVRRCGWSSRCGLWRRGRLSCVPSR